MTEPPPARPVWFQAHLLLALAVLLAILGAKFLQIDRYGSDLPYWDQWDAEGDHLLRPYVDGKLQASDLLAPHNEHRPAFTRLLALGLFEGNDRVWDARVEMVANAVVHALSALLLLALARRFLSGGMLLGFAVLLAILFSHPVSWENTLSGFQSQFYFILLFSALHLAGTLLAAPRSWSWWLAPLAGIAALFSMASGLLSALAILAVVAARALRDRRLAWTDAYVVACNAAFCVAGWLLKTEVAGHAQLKAASLGTWLDAFVHQFSWPVIDLWAAPLGMLPAAALAFAYFRRRVDGPLAQLLLGACTWFVLQCATLAYGRGAEVHGYGSRYCDTLGVGLLLSFLALAYLAHTAAVARARHGWLGLAAVFVAVMLAGLGREIRTTFRDTLDSMPAVNEARIASVRRYLATQDPAFFNKIPWDELPYPSAPRLASLLDLPSLRQTLPTSVRPPFPLAADPSATRAFATSIPDSTPGPVPQELPSWSSTPDEPAQFISLPFAVDRTRLSVFAMAEGTGKNAIHLVDDQGRRIAPLGALPASPRWQRLNFSVPAGTYRLAATHDGAGRFAFTAPIFSTALSNLGVKIPRCGGWLLGAGMLLGLAAIVAGLRPRVSGTRPSLRNAGSAALAALFGLALTVVLLLRLHVLDGAALARAPAADSRQIPDFRLLDPAAPGQPGARFVGGAYVIRSSANRWLGTYVGGDAFTGRVVSTSFPLTEAVLHVPILGYPNSTGNRLTLEILPAALQPAESIDFTGQNPRESPGAWHIPVTAWRGRTARLILQDGETGFGGWLAIGPPLAGGPLGIDWLVSVPRNHATFALSVLACAALLFLPGLALRTWWPERFPLGPALLALPGLLGLAGAGLAAWMGGPGHSDVPANLWLLAHIGFASALGVAWWRGGGPLRGAETVALGIYASVAVAALAFGVLPLPVAQEYSAHTTGQSRMIASPPDHEIPYRTAAYFYHGKDGRQDRVTYFGQDWSVTSRGPFVPLLLVAAFVLFDTPPHDPPGFVFDRWPAAADGFHLARILGILSNALVVLAGAALAARLAPDAARPALAWLAIAPVVAINTDFVWPKLLATFFLLLAVRAAIGRQSLLGVGAFAALAHLCHPVGGLFAPPLMAFVGHLAWSEAGAGGPRIGSALRRMAGFAAVLLACLAPWLAFKAAIGGRDVFVHYPWGDGRGLLPADNLASWLRCRWDNLWITLVPGGFSLSAKLHDWLYGPLSEPQRWALGYAKSLPGALGLAGFVAAGVALFRRTGPVLATLRLQLLAGAFAFMLLFWGFSNDGLGRNCLEPLSVLLIVFAASATPASWRGWRWLLAFIALETLSVRVLGVLFAPLPDGSALDAEALTLAMIAGLATLAPAAWFFLRRARMS